MCRLIEYKNIQQINTEREERRRMTKYTSYTISSIHSTHAFRINHTHILNKILPL